MDEDLSQELILGQENKADKMDDKWSQKKWHCDDAVDHSVKIFDRLEVFEC